MHPELRAYLNGYYARTMARYDAMDRKLALMSEILAGVSTPQPACPMGTAADGGLTDDATVPAVVPAAFCTTTQAQEPPAVAHDAPPVYIEMAPVTCSTECLTQVDAVTSVDKVQDDVIDPINIAAPTSTCTTGVLDHLCKERMLPVYTEQQQWPPPVPVQIVVNNATLFHGIAHGCIYGDSGYVWWPPDPQLRKRNELTAWISPTQYATVVVHHLEKNNSETSVICTSASVVHNNTGFTCPWVQSEDASTKFGELGTWPQLDYATKSALVQNIEKHLNQSVQRRALDISAGFSQEKLEGISYHGTFAIHTAYLISCLSRPCPWPSFDCFHTDVQLKYARLQLQVTYLMQHFSGALNSLRESLKYLQSMQLKLPWPMFLSNCRAVPVWSELPKCNFPRPDKMPERLQITTMLVQWQFLSQEKFKGSGCFDSESRPEQVAGVSKTRIQLAVLISLEYCSCKCRPNCMILVLWGKFKCLLIFVGIHDMIMVHVYFVDKRIGTETLEKGDCQHLRLEQRTKDRGLLLSSNQRPPAVYFGLANSSTASLHTAATFIDASVQHWVILRIGNTWCKWVCTTLDLFDKWLVKAGSSQNGKVIWQTSMQYLWRECVIGTTNKTFPHTLTSNLCSAGGITFTSYGPLSFSRNHDPIICLESTGVTYTAILPDQITPMYSACTVDVFGAPMSTASPLLWHQSIAKAAHIASNLAQYPFAFFFLDNPPLELETGCLLTNLRMRFFGIVPYITPAVVSGVLDLLNTSPTVGFCSKYFATVNPISLLHIGDWVTHLLGSTSAIGHHLEQLWDPGGLASYLCNTRVLPFPLRYLFEAWIVCVLSIGIQMRMGKPMVSGELNQCMPIIFLFGTLELGSRPDKLIVPLGFLPPFCSQSGKSTMSGKISVLGANDDLGSFTVVQGRYWISVSNQEKSQGGRSFIVVVVVLVFAQDIADHKHYFGFHHDNTDNTYTFEAFFNGVSTVHDFCAYLIQVCPDFCYHHDCDQVEEEHQVQWDPGGSRWRRLGVKPSFKEGGMLGAQVYVGLPLLPTHGLGPAVHHPSATRYKYLRRRQRGGYPGLDQANGTAALSFSYLLYFLLSPSSLSNSLVSDLDSSVME